MATETQGTETEIAPVRDGDALDWRALETWLRQHVADLPEAQMTAQQFPRGHANLTYLLHIGEVRLVLRRPPHGRTAPGAHDMAREYRVLSKLWQAYPRAPRAFAMCDDTSIIGAPFVVQEYRDGGVVVFKTLPASMQGQDNFGERVTAALARALADLHRVDYTAIGLGEFGRPDGYLQRQLDNWQDRWERVAGAQHVPGLERLGDMLAREVPDSTRAAIIHNDFKLDNCQFRPGEADTVVSVFDWDMATVGDPLVDIGIALDYWHFTRANAAIGVPSKEAFARAYAGHMDIDVAQLGWYEAFASWRSGIAVQQLYDRYLQGHTRDERMKRAGRTVPEFAERGLAALNGWKP